MSKITVLPGGGRPVGRRSARHLTLDERAEGLAWARAWRVRMKPYFDALYPAEPKAVCGGCGRALERSK